MFLGIWQTSLVRRDVLGNLLGPPNRTNSTQNEQRAAKGTDLCVLVRVPHEQQTRKGGHRVGNHNREPRTACPHRGRPIFPQPFTAELRRPKGSREAEAPPLKSLVSRCPGNRQKACFSDELRTLHAWCPYFTQKFLCDRHDDWTNMKSRRTN